MGRDEGMASVGLDGWIWDGGNGWNPMDSGWDRLGLPLGPRADPPCNPRPAATVTRLVRASERRAFARAYRLAGLALPGKPDG
jgi:hypothetical protein